MKKNLNLVIKESITEALLRLMKQHNFYDISITAITELAGVSRVSFYRNFDSKEDVLIKHIFDRTTADFNALSPQTTKERIAGLFVVINAISDIVELLYSQQLSHLLLAYFRSVVGAKSEQSNTDAYINSITMGICFGALDEWIRRGRQESPEQMAEILQNTMARFTLENR